MHIYQQGQGLYNVFLYYNLQITGSAKDNETS